MFAFIDTCIMLSGGERIEAPQPLELITGHVIQVWPLISR